MFRSHRNGSRGILNYLETFVVRIVVLTWQPAKRREPNVLSLQAMPFAAVVRMKRKFYDKVTEAKPADARSRRSAVLLVFLATLLWSTNGFFAKSPWFHDWSGLSIACWRAAFASLILFPLVRRPCWSLKLLPVALIFAAMNYFFLNAMQLGSAANAIWLQHTAPFWIVLVGFLWLGEKAGWRDLLVLGFQMIGVVWILVVELQGTTAVAVLFGLLAGFTYALVQLSLRWMRDQDPAWLVAVNHLVTVLVLLPFVVRFGQFPQGIQWLLLAIFGMLQMGLPYLFFARGLQSLSTHEAAGIVLLEPVLVPLWVYLAWSQTDHYVPPSWSTFVGGGFILLGLLMRCWTIKIESQVRPDSRTQDNDPRRETE